MAARGSRLLGRPEPRLFTEPIRPLTRKTTHGYAVIDFARAIGQPLLPWQERAVIRGLELNPDGTYRFRILLILVARQNGKTHLSKILKLWKMYVGGARLVLGVGQDLVLAKEVWQGCLDMVHEDADLAAELANVRYANGEVEFKITNGARYLIRAANRSAGRGLSVDQLDFEELREQRDWAAWSALSKTTSARPQAQIICLSNAGDDDSVVLNQLRDSALAGRDPTIGLLEWSAPDGCGLDDWDAIAQANPAVGHISSLEVAIRSAMATDPPAVFRTEVLCQRVSQLDGAFDLGAWRECADPRMSLADDKERLSVCVDVAPNGAHVTLAGAATTSDDRVRLDVLAAWRSTEAARVELPDMLEDLAPEQVAWFPGGPAAALAPLFRKPAIDAKHRGHGQTPGRAWEIIELTGGKVGEACQGLVDLVAARRIIHPGNALLDAHVGGSQKLHSGDSWRFVRRGVGQVDAAYAAAGAAYVAQLLPSPRRKWTSLVV